MSARCAARLFNLGGNHWVVNAETAWRFFSSSHALLDFVSHHTITEYCYSAVSCMNLSLISVLNGYCSLWKYSLYILIEFYLGFNKCTLNNSFVFHLIFLKKFLC